MSTKKTKFGALNFKQPVVASELRFGGDGSRLVGNDGHINANSKKDLAAQVLAMLQTASQGVELVTEEAAVKRERLAKHKQLVEAAFADKGAQKELGEVMADEIYQTANRQGFMRRFLAQQTLNQGELPRVKMRLKNALAVITTSTERVHTQFVKDPHFAPPEFYISSDLFIEEREIQQCTGDTLEEKYIEGLEGIMVQEDRLWVRSAKKTVGIANPQTTLLSTLTPLALGRFQNQVANWGLPVRTFLAAQDLSADIIGDPQFAAAIDQVSKHELLLTGKLGTLYGMEMVTDGFRHAEHKVLGRGEMFVVSSQEHHGTYTDRGGVTSAPTSGEMRQVPGRGWFFNELISLMIVNPRSVAFAVRRA